MRHRLQLFQTGRKSLHVIAYGLIITVTQVTGDTRVLRIMNIYPDGFIFTEARPIYKSTLTVQRVVTIPGLVYEQHCYRLFPTKTRYEQKGE